MTPDDIRHATFDRVRKGVDPEQVKDLLARVAFLLEKSPGIDLDEVDDDDPGALIDLESTDQHGPEAVPQLTVVREPAVDHRMLADTLGAVIAATEELVRWKAELERTADGHAVNGRPPSGPTPSPSQSPLAADDSRVHIDGVDELHRRIAYDTLPSTAVANSQNGHRVHV